MLVLFLAQGSRSSRTLLLASLLFYPIVGSAVLCDEIYSNSELSSTKEIVRLFANRETYDFSARAMGKHELEATLDRDGYQLHPKNQLDRSQQEQLFKAFESLLPYRFTDPPGKIVGFNPRTFFVHRTQEGDWVYSSTKYKTSGSLHTELYEINNPTLLDYFNRRYEWLENKFQEDLEYSLAEETGWGSVTAKFEVRVDGTTEANKRFHLDNLAPYNQKIIFTESINGATGSMSNTWGVNRRGEVFVIEDGVPITFLSHDGPLGPGFYHASPPIESNRVFLRALISRSDKTN